LQRLSLLRWALTKKIEPNIAIIPQLILLTENLSTKRPVNNGTNKPLKLPNEVMITAAMINPYGHESLLNKKNKVDKFSVSSINWGMIAIFGSIFLVNALLSGIGLYLLSKIGEKIIYAIRSLLWEHIIQLKMPFFDKNESGQLMSRLKIR
jgi:ABC-type multidrug transport system fused ATPase/permease subunit